MAGWLTTASRLKKDCQRNPNYLIYDFDPKNPTLNACWASRAINEGWLAQNLIKHEHTQPIYFPKIHKLFLIKAYFIKKELSSLFKWFRMPFSILILTDFSRNSYYMLRISRDTGMPAESTTKQKKKKKMAKQQQQRFG